MSLQRLNPSILSPFDANRFDDVFFDISHNNGTQLDFTKLATTRKGVIYKVTEGTSFVDHSFVRYCDAAVKAGIQYHAVYHFAHHGNEQGQMDFFINSFQVMAHGLGNKPKFLFMLDTERGANPPDEDTAFRMNMILENKYKINAAINYCGFDFWTGKYAQQMAPRPCFLASYTGHPISPIPWRIPSPTVYGFDLWQYTGDSLGPWAKDIPGGSHGMDLSCFNHAKNGLGLDATWNKWLAQTQQP